jgi:hypocretin (orexin) receptor 2
MTLTAISIERYYAICHPLKFKATLRRARIMIAVIWLISAVILLPDVIVLQTFRRFPPELPTGLLTSCKPAWGYPYQVSIVSVRFNRLPVETACSTLASAPK